MTHATPPLSRLCLRAALPLLAALAVAGCKPDPAVQKGEVVERGIKYPRQPPPTPQWSEGGEGGFEPPVTQMDSGQIDGVVLFTGKPPERIAIDTSMDPACSQPGAAPVLTEQYVIDAGKLANVFLYIKSGPVRAIRAQGGEAVPVILNQRGCQYIPHVIAIPAGGYVKFENSDATMHNVHTMPVAVGNETVDISMGPHGTPIVKQFSKPELMMPVRCNNHPWMNAFINVSPTPFFAISDAEGRFTLRGLPAGDYVLAAVHEKLGERDIHVTVKPHGAVSTEVIFAAK